ncbi:MAG: DUF2889 domain-containing protein [Ramlibacter sp.]|nr:DUF2889 domain-containing protein [Ramlibacter sp.]
MTLPAPAPRKPLHTRRITFEGFLRDDGLFDIDAELVDSKSEPIRMHERGLLPPGGAIHHMRVRVTVDDTLTIRAIATAIDAAPFGECQRALGPLQKLVGATLGAGWRKAIESAMGGVAGCTHLRELLFNVATAAFQTIPIHLSQQREARGEQRDPDAPAPYFLGKCLSWDREGPVVQRVLPLYYRPPARKP